MKIIVSILLFILVLSSCELTTEQETQLNKDLSNLITVRNNGDALSYLNHTHPIIVKHYKSLGDSVYKKRFQTVTSKTSRDNVDSSEFYWTNAYQKSVKSNDSLIQVKIEVFLAKGYDKIDSTSFIYGIANKNGSNWLFVEEQDYYSDYFPSDLRLFEE